MHTPCRAGLLHALPRESPAPAAAAALQPMVLRALCVLMSAAPYERLPPKLLPSTTATLLARWGALQACTPPAPLPPPATAPTPPPLPTPPGPAISTATGAWGGSGAGLSALHVGEAMALQAAHLACLAEAFSTKQPLKAMAAYLRTLMPQHSSAQAEAGAEAGAVEQRPAPTAPAAPAAGGAGSGAGAEGAAADEAHACAPAFVHQLMAAGTCGHAAVRIEALAALKGLATHYDFALPGVCATHPPHLAHPTLRRAPYLVTTHRILCLTATCACFARRPVAPRVPRRGPEPRSAARATPHPQLTAPQRQRSRWCSWPCSWWPACGWC